MPWIMRIGFRLLAWASGESVLFPRAWNSRVLVLNYEEEYSILDMLTPETISCRQRY